MNNKLLVVILIICGLLVFGLASRDGEVLVLAVPFLVYLVVGLIQAPDEVELAAARALEKTGMRAGESAAVHLEIYNQGEAQGCLRVRDELAPTMRVLAGHPAQKLALNAGETTELDYQLTACRGAYRWEAIEVAASDPFGLFEIKSDLSAPGDLLVFPQPIKMRATRFRPRATLHAAGPIPARSAGSGIDFWGVREYRPGDSLRHLNWRLAARSATHSRNIFTNEFEREEIGDYGLILDARKFSANSRLEDEMFEHSVSAAAALSESFLTGGNRLSLLIFGDSLLSLFPGYGKQQINKVRSCLARARVGKNFPFAYLEYLPIRLFPSRSMIVIFSPVTLPDFDVYARLVSYGYEVVLIAPDPVDLASRMESPRLSSLALRAAAVERVVLLKKLMQLGVKVVDWKVSQPFDAAIRQTANSLSQVRNI